MKMQLEWITPERASGIISQHRGNRTRAEAWVDQLKRYMDEGKFILTHQGIAFNCDGSLKDGQHRLAAIVKHGKPVQMWVAYGVADKAMDWIDTHKVRTDRDNLHIHGNIATTGFVAVAKAMRFYYLSSKRAERDSFREFCEMHKEAIDFSISNGSSKPMTLAVVRAIVARATYTADPNRLREFGRILCGGATNDEGDTAASVFMNFMLRNFPGYGSAANTETYQKCQCALWHFIRHEPLKKVYCREGVLFPIPGDPE